MSIRNELLEKILAAILSGGGAPSGKPEEPSGNYTIQPADAGILFKTASTLTLIPASQINGPFDVTATNGNVTINTAGQTINGVAGNYTVVSPNSARLTPYSGGFWLT